MRGCKLFVYGVAALTVAVGSWADTSGGAPPELSISSPSSLAQVEVEQLRQRLKYWADEIIAGTAAGQVATAAAGARNDYRLYSARDYQYRFAEIAGEVFVPVIKGGLDEDDRLRLMKEVNLAIVLARIPQVNIMPALTSMLEHPNSAVRYLGWEGYRLNRTGILAQSREYAQNMLDATIPAAEKETSAPVIGSIFSVANISLGLPAVPASTIKEAQQRMFAMLEANWLKWCKRVMAGEAEMSRACENSIEGVKTLAAAQAGGQDSKAKALQMLADLMHSAAGAYDFSAGTGPIAEENSILLRACEAALVELSGLTSNRIVAILADEKFEGDRSAALGLKVYDWFDDLKQFGVSEPRVKAASKPKENANPEPATQ